MDLVTRIALQVQEPMTIITPNRTKMSQAQVYLKAVDGSQQAPLVVLLLLPYCRR